MSARALRKLLATATPRPWRVHLPGNASGGCRAIQGNKAGSHRQAQWRTGIGWTEGLGDDEEDRANAELIVAAVGWLPLALDALDYAFEYLHGEIDPEDGCECLVCMARAASVSPGEKPRP